MNWKYTGAVKIIYSKGVVSLVNMVLFKGAADLEKNRCTYVPVK